MNASRFRPFAEELAAFAGIALFSAAVITLCCALDGPNDPASLPAGRLARVVDHRPLWRSPNEREAGPARASFSSPDRIAVLLSTLEPEKRP